MKNKKATHVGIVLSFILFITFITFMFAILKVPSKIGEEKKFIINSLEKELMENVANDVDLILLTNTTPQTSKDCLKFDEASLNLRTNYIVKDENDLVAASDSNENFLYFDWDESVNLFKIFTSEEEFNMITTSSPLDCENLEIKSVIQSKEIFETKIINVLENYESNYSLLKTTLKIPENSEFKIQFKYKNNTMLGGNLSDVHTDIFVKDVQITYLDKNATKKIGNLLINVW